MAQFQQRSHTSPANLSGETSRDRQRKAASQQLNQIAQRNNYRGYDGTQNSSRREAAQQTLNKSTTQQHRSELKAKAQQHPVSQQQRDTASVLNPLRRSSVRHFARICTPMCLAGTTVDRRHGNRNSYAAWKAVAAVT